MPSFAKIQVILVVAVVAMAVAAVAESSGSKMVFAALDSVIGRPAGL